VGIAIIDIMNAKLLGEYRFVKFFGIVAPLCAALAGALTWYDQRRAGAER